MTIQDISKTLKIIVIALVVTLGTNVVFGAWTPAPQNPPDNNVAAPLNVGTSPQSKEGGVAIGTKALPDTGNIFQVLGNSLFTGTSIFKGTVGVNKLIASAPDAEAIKVSRGEGTSAASFGMGTTGAVLNSPNTSLFIQPVEQKVIIGNSAGVPDNAKLHVGGLINATGDVCTTLNGGKCLSKITATALTVTPEGWFGSSAVRLCGATGNPSKDCSAAGPAAMTNRDDAACPTNMIQIGIDMGGGGTIAIACGSIK